MDASEMNSDIQEVLRTHEQNRHDLIPILQGIQNHQGYISEEAIEHVAQYLNISENDIYGVATFYTQFRFTRPGDHIIRVCEGTACHVIAGTEIMDEFCKNLRIKPRETTPDYKFTLESVACVGSCALSPVVMVDNKVHGRLEPTDVKKLIRSLK